MPIEVRSLAEWETDGIPGMLSVVIPAHNEEGRIASTVRACHDVLATARIRHEILVINDNSRDRTEDVLKELGREIKELHYINNAPPNGFGFAVRAGLAAFRGEAVAIVMADASDSPDDLVTFYRKMQEGYDYVGTIRRQRQDTWFRRNASRAMNKLREKLTHIRMTDQGCMMRAYSRDIINVINQCDEINTFIPALAYSFSANPTEIEIGHEERMAGESKYSLYKLIRLNFDLVTGFSVVPLQMFSIIGMLTAAGSVLFLLIVLITRTLSGGNILDGLRAIYDRDILGFFLIGLTLFGIGLLGEYVGRIYQQVRSRPRYMVKAVLEQKRGDD